MTVDVAVVLGTRPGAIKLAPVILALRDAGRARVMVIASGQHGALADAALGHFGIVPDIRLDCAAGADPLPVHCGRLVSAIGAVLARLAPGLVLGQGDTTTALAAAVAASQLRLPFGHVEAGLRSGNRDDPFPEETNRVLIGRLATLHFAPTPGARGALLAEGIDGASIVLTGNTAIDALAETIRRRPTPPAPPGRTILLTAHRRESHGPRLGAMLEAVADVVAARPDVRLLFPVHPNPAVRHAARTIAGRPRVTLAEPLDYPAFVDAMRTAHVIVSDAGGVQEEAPYLGVPLLVIRDTTERPEGVAAGAARLAGTKPAAIGVALSRLLDDPVAHAAMRVGASPYGDGRAAERIVAAIRDRMRDGPAAAVDAPALSPEAMTL